MSAVNPNSFPIEQPPTPSVPESLPIDAASPEGQALLAEPGRGRRGKKPQEQNSIELGAPEESPWVPAKLDEASQEGVTDAPEEGEGPSDPDEEEDDLYIAPGAWASPSSSSDYPTAEIEAVPSAPASKPAPVTSQPIATFGYTGLPGEPTHAITIHVPMSALTPGAAGSAEHQATPAATTPEEGPQLPAETASAVEAYEQRLAGGTSFDDLETGDKLELLLKIDAEHPEPGTPQYDAYRTLRDTLHPMTRKRLDIEIRRREGFGVPDYSDPQGVNLGGLGGLSIGSARLAPATPSPTGDRVRGAEPVSAAPEFHPFDTSGYDADQLTAGENTLQDRYFNGEGIDAFRNREPRAQVAIMLLAAESFTPGATPDDVTLIEASWHTLVERLDPAVRSEILAQFNKSTVPPVVAQRRPERAATPSARHGRFAKLLGSIGVGPAAPKPELPAFESEAIDPTQLPEELRNAEPITHEPRRFLGRKPKEPRAKEPIRSYSRESREAGIK